MAGLSTAVNPTSSSTISHTSNVILYRDAFVRSFKREDLETRKIAAVFGLQPTSVYLSTDFDNEVIFPNETGRFNHRALNENTRYEVQGESIGQGPSGGPTISSSIGRTTFSNSLTPPPLPPPLISPSIRPTFTASNRAKNKKITKTVALVALSGNSDNKTSSNISYKCVTQVTVFLDPHNCGPSPAAQNIESQVGYQVILLDSKCFPILDNEVTRTPEYWKSTRKILAACKSIYLSLKGSSSNPENAQAEIDDNTNDDDTIPKKRLRIIEDKIDSQVSFLKQIENKVHNLVDRMTFAETLTNTFECVVCKGIDQRPVFTSCCSRIIGCKICIDQWIEGNRAPICPLCATPVSQDQPFVTEVKGMEEMLYTAASIMRSHDLIIPSRQPEQDASNPFPEPPEDVDLDDL